MGFNSGLKGLNRESVTFFTPLIYFGTTKKSGPVVVCVKEGDTFQQMTCSPIVTVQQCLFY
jgi:hypothetical protein